uniref:Uncharacterized protein n=1 Tax=Erythrolobus australicus TaxID=1077150 RepID=A0A7S1TKM7_9RHOD|mmetsp:Transcript_2010/g.5334  ORF Transcript_2010/g.5334 Transcript_2010/m.5334 type:complete len:117 (+) Transcript_2010:485-835(+)
MHDKRYVSALYIQTNTASPPSLITTRAESYLDGSSKSASIGVILCAETRCSQLRELRVNRAQRLVHFEAHDVKRICFAQHRSQATSEREASVSGAIAAAVPSSAQARMPRVCAPRL